MEDDVVAADADAVAKRRPAKSAPDGVDAMTAAPRARSARPGPLPHPNRDGYWLRSDGGRECGQNFDTSYVPRTEVGAWVRPAAAMSPSRC